MPFISYIIRVLKGSSRGKARMPTHKKSLLDLILARKFNIINPRSYLMGAALIAALWVCRRCYHWQYGFWAWHHYTLLFSFICALLWGGELKRAKVNKGFKEDQQKLYSKDLTGVHVNWSDEKYDRNPLKDTENQRKDNGDTVTVMKVWKSHISYNKLLQMITEITQIVFFYKADIQKEVYIFMSFVCVTRYLFKIKIVYVVKLKKCCFFLSLINDWCP